MWESRSVLECGGCDFTGGVGRSGSRNHRLQAANPPGWGEGLLDDPIFTAGEWGRSGPQRMQRVEGCRTSVVRHLRPLVLHSLRGSFGISIPEKRVANTCWGGTHSAYA